MKSCSRKLLRDISPGVRQHALQLAEPRLQTSAKLQKAVLALVGDPAPEVRFQLAFTLGAWDAPNAVAALAKVAQDDADEKWTQTAVLSSAAKSVRRGAAGDTDRRQGL